MHYGHLLWDVWFWSAVLFSWSSAEASMISKPALTLSLMMNAMQRKFAFTSSVAGRIKTFLMGEPYVGPSTVFLFFGEKHTFAISPFKPDVMYEMYSPWGLFHWPAHLGGAVEEFYLVLIRGNKEELLRGGRRVPSHAHRHCTLLHTFRAQNEKFVRGAVFQIILHLLKEKSAKHLALKKERKRMRIWNAELVTTKKNRQTRLTSQRSIPRESSRGRLLSGWSPKRRSLMGL